MPSSPTSKKTAEPTTSRPIGARSLADILGEGQTLKAWLRPGKGARTEAFIILAEGLSPEDREFLAGAADLVVDPSDDLPGRLARLARENRQLKSLSLSDDLTGLYNRRFFSLQLEIEMARSRRTGQPCCLMMIDFDNFKDINDRLGHDEGDRFLTQMGGLIREKLRPTDFVCRYGGDEFAVIMPATCLPDGAGIAARLREFTAHFTWKMAVRVSASFGLAVFEPPSPIDAEEFLKQADSELYRAKQTGKNRICHPALSPAQARLRQPVDRGEREALFGLEAAAHME
ncbi:MAG: GGDEF domain-containing protein [Syntrophaceae bacterium]|nr:GGDEF domain-containing protein [Syntrophaceae bacterium]